MLTLRCARQTRALICPSSGMAPGLLLFSTTTEPSRLSSLSSSYPLLTSSTSNAAATTTSSNGSIDQSDVGHYFRDWLMSRKKPLFGQIFEIIRTKNDSAADLALSRLNLHLTEALVLDFINYDKRDVLSCLKFFDWAGRQRGFYHTKVTFDALFRVFSNAKLMTLMMDFLQNFMKQKYIQKATYHGILVVGYAVAGECETALKLFGKMRFKGTDLNVFAYHVLLNSLVEHGYFDYVGTLVNEIKARGLQNEVTHTIVIKSFAKQNEIDKGEVYLRGLLSEEELTGRAVGAFVGALCRDNQFERAALLLEEFSSLGVVSMEPSYGVWIRQLVNAGKLDGALQFLRDKKMGEGYVPDVFRYNSLISKLLGESRFEEVFDLLIEMKENDIRPDNVTVNVFLCLLCKVGRMDIAMDLYNSRAEFGLSVNCMAYNYLINALLGDVGVDEAYRILKNSVEQGGYFPGEKTFLIIAHTLCREGKQNKMRDLVQFMSEQSTMPNMTYNRLVWSLCDANRADDGYLVHNLLNRQNKLPTRLTYVKLISRFCESSKPEIAARLLLEMQERGFKPKRDLVTDVVFCICCMDKPEKLFFRFLEMQLPISHFSEFDIYRLFISGAGIARKPELARQVYEMMHNKGIVQDFRSDILLLQSYLKSENTPQALNLFKDLSNKWRNRKLWSTMVVGLCKSSKPIHAAQILEAMRSTNRTPSKDCYDELIKMYCELQQYHTALDLVNDMTRLGRPISTFIGNIFLLHSLKSRKLNNCWATYSSQTQHLTPSCWMLGHLIGVFSGCVEEQYSDDEIEKLIQECFSMDIFTNNMLLRRASIYGMDYACRYFERLCQKGYVPNRWSHDIIVHGLVRDGQYEDAKIWIREMLRKGYYITDDTMQRLM